MELIIAYLMELAKQYPAMASGLMVMGILRLVFKPLMALLHAYVDATPNEADNAALAKAEESAVFKAFAFVLDYFTSVKISKV